MVEKMKTDVEGLHLVSEIKKISLGQIIIMCIIIVIQHLVFFLYSH